MFIVIEIQTNQDGTVGNVVTAYEDRLRAEAAYHSVLAAAALSELPCHAAVMVEGDGTFVDSQHYEH